MDHLARQRKQLIDHGTTDASPRLKGINNKMTRIKYNSDDTTSSCISSELRQLPNELVSLIIQQQPQKPKNLYEFTLVSKQFYIIANPLLWKRIQLTTRHLSQRFITAFFDTSTPQRLSALGEHIQQLRLSDTWTWREQTILRLLRHTPNLQVFGIGRNFESHQYGYLFTLGDIIFQHIGYHRPQITCLELDVNQLTRECFAVIGRQCQHLTHLKWKCSIGSSDAKLTPLLTQFPLTCLEILQPRSPLSEKLQTLIQNMNQLTRLKIHHRTRSNAPTFFMIAPYTYSTTMYWPQLTLLDLGIISNLDQHTLIEFIKSHPYLEEIRISLVWGLSDTCLDTMALWLPNLSCVDLTSGGREKAPFSVGGVQRLIDGCLCLISLELYAFDATSLQQHFQGSFDGDFSETHIKLNQQGIRQIRRHNNSSNG